MESVNMKWGWIVENIGCIHQCSYVRVKEEWIESSSGDAQSTKEEMSLRPEDLDQFFSASDGYSCSKNNLHILQV